uniref:Uncharacterized protein n=1 Tax=Rhizophagus irregularis (strain DAOM 181602 / DAOM 197198 / MUCL 43194) TaxID=747089 RepID=U9TYS1_RHIID
MASKRPKELPRKRKIISLEKFFNREGRGTGVFLNYYNISAIFYNHVQSPFFLFLKLLHDMPPKKREDKIGPLIMTHKLENKITIQVEGRCIFSNVYVVEKVTFEL